MRAAFVAPSTAEFTLGPAFGRARGQSPSPTQRAGEEPGYFRVRLNTTPSAAVPPPATVP
jgi:hypothetical protein